MYAAIESPLTSLADKTDSQNCRSITEKHFSCVIFVVLYTPQFFIRLFRMKIICHTKPAHSVKMDCKNGLSPPDCFIPSCVARGQGHITFFFFLSAFFCRIAQGAVFHQNLLCLSPRCCLLPFCSTACTFCRSTLTSDSSHWSSLGIQLTECPRQSYRMAHKTCPFGTDSPPLQFHLEFCWFVYLLPSWEAENAS